MISIYPLNDCRVSILPLRLFCLLVLLICTTSCNADQFSANISTGYEKNTSPLVNIDFDTPLIFVEGRNKLAGHFYQLNLSTMKNWELSNNVSVDISANTIIKDVPEAKDLNFSIAFLDFSIRKKWGDFTLSLSPSVQRIWVENKPFRDSTAMQTDLTYVMENGNFTDLYLALSKNNFVEEYEFFDSKASTASLTQHIVNFGYGIDVIDLQLSVNREKNIKHEEDLSYYAYFARASIDKKMLGLTWSLGASSNKSYFDEAFFDGFEKRVDNNITYEMSVERQLSDKLAFLFEITHSRNYSNLALFESDYKAFNISLSYQY